MLKNSWVAVLCVDRVDRERGVVVYEPVRAVQGRDWPDWLRHAVRLDGEVAAGLRGLEAGDTAVGFAWDRLHQLHVTFVGGTWYTSTEGERDRSWTRIRSVRPDLDCVFSGSAGELVNALDDLRAGRPVIALCRKEKRGAPVQFVRYAMESPEKREPVPALDEVGGELVRKPEPDAKGLAAALRRALQAEDPLVRRVAQRMLSGAPAGPAWRPR